MAQVLRGYNFKRIQILKDQELGRGSYGMVCKALCDELLCAAKLLHPVLVSERNVQKFQQECQILSYLKHPNIIQYLGTHNDGPNSCQIILMELMEESLTSFLNRSTPPLPFHIEVNLSHDISLALAYLHSNDIIHRDLSSNNVLLTADKRAKVTDFGMSRLAESSAHLTQAPGCPIYMPPEALAHTPKYSNMLDIFSLGVLIIQILTCKFPSPGSPRKKLVDKRYSLPIEVPVIETERRKAHIDLVDPTHPLLKHACACLNYDDKDRPTAQEMCHHMLELEKKDRYLKAKCEFEGALQKVHYKLKETKEEVSKRDELIAKMNEEISRMSEALIKVNEDMFRQGKIISEKDEEIFKKDQLLQRKDEELTEKDQHLFKIEKDVSKKEKHFCAMEIDLRASLEQLKDMLTKKENDLEKLKDKVKYFVEGLLQTVEDLVATKVFSDETQAARKGPTDPLEGQGIGMGSLLDERFPQASSEVENDLTCQLCHKLFENPRVLPCLHIMCKTCIESLLSSREGGACCPHCQTPVIVPQEGTLNSMPIPFSVANIIEVSVTLKKARESSIVCKNCGSAGTAAAYCVDCTSLQCVSCYKKHHEIKVLSEHAIVEISELTRLHLPTKMAGPMCPKHTTKKLELYCCDCERLVCIECAYVEHPKQHHSVKPAKEMVSSFKAEVETSMVSLTALDTQLQGIIASTSQGMVALLEQEQIIVHLIKELSDPLIPSLIKESDYKGQKLFKLVKDDLQMELRSMELYQMKIKTVISFVKYLTDHSCDEEFVSMKQVVCARIEQLKEMYRELKDNNKLILVHMEQLREVCIELQLKLKSNTTGLLTDTLGSSQEQVSSTNGSGGASSYDLSNIMAAVSTISGQWKELGSGLGLQPVILDAIQGPPEVCMVDVIKHWIHEAMPQTLFSALVRMGRTDVAEKMAGVEPGSSGSLLADGNVKRDLNPNSFQIILNSNLNPDILYLLEKIPDGDIDGVVYKPSECAAIIQGPTTEAVDVRVAKLQSAYQKTESSAQFKAKEIQHASSLDSNIVLFLVAKLNSRHNQCAFIYMEEKHMVRLISGSPQQYAPAKKELKEYLDRAKSSKHKSSLFAMKICGNRVVTLKQSDIVTEEVEVIVNATNEQLLHGVGVPGVLDRASVGQSKTSTGALDAQMGDVVVICSDRGALKCRQIYHAFVPRSSEYSPTVCTRLFEQLVKTVLVVAETNGILSIAFPAISSSELMAERIIDTIINHQFTSRPPVLGDIRIVINDSPTFDYFAKYFNQRKKEVTTTPSNPKNTSTSPLTGTLTGTPINTHTGTPTDTLTGTPINTHTGTPTGTPKITHTNIVIAANVEKRENIDAILTETVEVPSDVKYLDRNRSSTFAGDVRGVGQADHNPARKRSSSMADVTDNCSICLSLLQDPVIQDCCHRAYCCRSCLNQRLEVSPYCPTCNKVMRMGNQPDGTMDVAPQPTPLRGYPGCGTIVITYNIPDGIQGPQHPNPGQRYTGIHIIAYLPDNQEGNEVLKLLQKAWDAKLIFTIGTSSSSEHNNVVIWNEIHHKTNTHGGATGCGYPDNTYLSRVKKQLAAKGIRPN